MESDLAKQITELTNLSAIWSISASIASIVLAIVAIVLAVHFYSQAKKSEKDVSNSLNKIEAQADALSKITNKHLDRFTKQATEKRTSANDPDLKIFLELANSITQGLTQSTGNSSINGDFDVIKYSIGSLYYCATTNYYAFMSLPKAANYDESNTFHATTKRLLDLTKSDVDFLLGYLSKIPEDNIKDSGLSNLYDEALESWVPSVRDSAAAFAKLEQLKESA